MNRWTVVAAIFLLGLALGCNNNGTPPARETPAEPTALPNEAHGAPKGKVVKIKPGAKVQEETQAALIKAKPGDTIEFEEGTFEFTMSLSLAVDNVTIRGQGMDKTTLSFAKQDAGKEGLLVTRGQFRIE